MTARCHLRTKRIRRCWTCHRPCTCGICAQCSKSPRVRWRHSQRNVRRTNPVLTALSSERVYNMGNEIELSGAAVNSPDGGPQE